MRDSTSELMRLCIEKVELEGEDAVFFQNVMNALLHAEAKSECRAQLEEAQVWFDKWRPLETRDLDWATDRLAKLHQIVENVEGNTVAISMTKEMAQRIYNLAENDPSVPLIEAKYLGMRLADLKQVALAAINRKDAQDS